MCEYILKTEFKNTKFQPLNIIDKMPLSADQSSVKYFQVKKLGKLCLFYDNSQICMYYMT